MDNEFNRLFLRTIEAKRRGEGYEEAIEELVAYCRENDIDKLELGEIFRVPDPRRDN